MVKFIEKHSRLLRTYCLIARILGWYLLLAGPFWFISLVSCYHIGEHGFEEQYADLILYGVGATIFDFIVPGFLAFAVSGLLDYLLRPESRPGTILKMTDKLCYVYAAFLILKALAANFWIIGVKFHELSQISESARILLIQPLLGPTVAKVLLLIGVGVILRRLLPVIEESKTLV